MVTLNTSLRALQAVYTASQYCDVRKFRYSVTVYLYSTTALKCMNALSFLYENKKIKQSVDGVVKGTLLMDFVKTGTATAIAPRGVCCRKKLVF